LCVSLSFFSFSFENSIFLIPEFTGPRAVQWRRWDFP
jgi:hypothetical protein